MSDVVSNEDFVNAKRTYRATLSGFTGRFRNVLNSDVLDYCGDLAIWQCLQKHDSTYDTKFTTSLYKFVEWQCLREYRRQRSILNNHEEQQEMTVMYDYDTSMMLVEYLSLLSDRDRRIVESRFLYNNTLLEIAQQEGCTKQGIHYILKQAMRKMKRAALAT
jgi:RNA polymerase sigma factor (sigma-70 family)